MPESRQNEIFTGRLPRDRVRSVSTNQHTRGKMISTARSNLTFRKRLERTGQTYGTGKLQKEKPQLRIRHGYRCPSSSQTSTKVNVESRSVADRRLNHCANYCEQREQQLHLSGHENVFVKRIHHLAARLQDELIGACVSNRHHAYECAANYAAGTPTSELRHRSPMRRASWRCQTPSGNGASTSGAPLYGTLRSEKAIQSVRGNRAAAVFY
jgi:hypothetical protein